MFDIDVNKMTLAQLSSSQVQNRFAVLLELQSAVTAKNRAQIEALTGRYSTEFFCVVANIPVGLPRKSSILLHKIMSERPTYKIIGSRPVSYASCTSTSLQSLQRDVIG